MKRWIALALALCLMLAVTPAVTLTGAAAGTPVEFQVEGGLLRVEPLREDLVRVRFAPDGAFRDKGLATFVDPAVKWDPVDYTLSESDKEYVLTTAKLKVTVDRSDGAVTYYTADGTKVAEEAGRVWSPLTLDGKQYYRMRQQFLSVEEEYLYGFGNVNDAVGIRGRTVTLAQGNTEKRSPMFYSNQGYGVLFDMTGNGALGWQNRNAVYSYTADAADSLDYYFFYGPEADRVIEGYRKVTGQATMLPKNSFGYVQSRNRYGSQQEILRNIQTFREKGIPLDVTVIDYYWWNGDFNNITQWSSSWPNPTAMMQTMHDNHVTAAISVWPSFKEGTPTYNAVSQKAGFLLEGNSNFGYVYDPTTRANREYYWSLIEQNVFSKGLDSIWLDACEPEMGNWAKSSGLQTAVGSSRPIGLLYPLLTDMAVYQGQRAIADNEKRVNTLTRGAVAGVQRYGTQSWSGDVRSTWEQLEKEVRGALNYSAAGLPYFSTDVGGYFGIDTGKEENREMFLRWLQFAAFSSIMRVHGEGCIKEPWSFGAEYEEYIVELIRLRERLVPYIYSLAGAVTREGYTPVRPLVFDFRTDKNVWTIDDQYMFGPSLMICPVDTLGTRSRQVYLPEGTWVDFWTGRTLRSRGETVTAEAPLDQVPVFVRGGAILPMAMESEYVDQHPEEGEIRVYMGADGAFTWYDDAGNGYGYEKGEFATVPMTYDEATRTLTLGDRQGSYPGMPEQQTLHLVFVQEDYGYGEPESREYQTTLTYEGKAVSVAFDPDWQPPVPPLKTGSLPKPEAAPRPDTADRALVGDWSFSEGEGAKVKDTSGNFNNGAVVNPATSRWGNGHKGYGLEFSGGSAALAGTFVEAADSPSLQFTDGISFSAWVKFTGNGHGNLFNKGGNGNNNPGVSFIILNGNQLQVELQDQAGKKTSAKASSAGFPKNSWHHVAFTWQSAASGGDGVVRIYTDGRLVSSETSSANKFTGPIGVTAYPVRLGCSADNEPAWPNYFKGTMDEAKAYNYALTPAEVAALAKDQSITLDNPADAAAVPGDGRLTLTWKDPAGEDFEKVAVTLTSREGETLTREAAKGQETLTVEGLTNDAYYRIALKAVYSGDRTSQGTYLVSGVGTAPALFDCLVTHDKTVYGFLTNRTGEPVTGLLTARVVDGAGETAFTSRQENFTVGALDSQRFTLDIGPYAEGQRVELTFTAGAQDLARPAALMRTLRYLTSAETEELRAQLQAAVDAPLDPADYTEESAAAYRQAVEKAKELLADPDASGSDLYDALRVLRSALVPVSRTAPGDVDGDGKVTSTDARLALQLAVGKVREGDLPIPAAADADGDGKVTSTDARLILQYSVGKIPEFPVK